MTQSQATDRESLLAIFFKIKFLKHYEISQTYNSHSHLKKSVDLYYFFILYFHGK